MKKPFIAVLAFFATLISASAANAIVCHSSKPDIIRQIHTAAGQSGQEPNFTVGNVTQVGAVVKGNGTVEGLLKYYACWNAEPRCLVAAHFGTADIRFSSLFVEYQSVFNGDPVAALKACFEQLGQ